MSHSNGSESSGKSLSYFKGLLSALSDGELLDPELSEVLEAMEEGSDLQIELQEYWLSLKSSQSILAGDSDIGLHNTEGIQQAHAFTLAVAEQISKLSPDAEDGNVVSITALKNRNSTILTSASEPENTVVSFDHALGFRNFAIAASVMFIVTFGWLGSQSEVRTNVLAWFDNDSILAPSGGEQLALPTDDIRIIPQGSVLVSASQGAITEGDLSSPNHSARHLGPDSTNNNATQTALHLSNSRVKAYIRLHAEHASLNTNHGIMPFARMTKVPNENQF